LPVLFFGPGKVVVPRDFGVGPVKLDDVDLKAGLIEEGEHGGHVEVFDLFHGDLDIFDRLS